MTIEIGTLIVRGTFGARRDSAKAEEERIGTAIDRLRQEMRAELRDIRQAAERPRREI
ncbi:MAG: hypothetical protein ACXIU8_06630 [Alkalilacustris sp.]